MNWLRLLVVCLSAASCCLTACSPVGPPRYEVTGIVLVDGKPAERVLVQFHSTNEQLQGDDRYPVAVTNAQGQFRLNEGSQQAGVLEGKYRVTFSWLSSPNLDAVDKFKGAFANDSKSKYVVDVPVSSVLEFSLQTPK